MKKSLTRVLSLVLVLVMMFSVVPMAAADGVTVTPTKSTLEYGTDTTTTVTASASAPEGEGWSEPTYRWEGASGSGATATYTAPSLGTTAPSATGRVTCTVTYTKEGTDPVIKTGYADIVTARPELSGIEINGPETAEKGQSVTLTVAQRPVGAFKPSGDPVWTGDCSSSGVLDTATVGEKNVSVSWGGKTDTYSVTVTAKKVALSGGHATVAMKVGETGKSVGLTMSPANATAAISYVSSDPDVVAVSSTGALTAKKAGTVTITATLALNESQTEYEISGPNTFTCVVTVTDGPYISCSSQSVQVGGTITLTPVLYLNSGKPVTGATFDCTYSGCSVTTTDNKTFIVTSPSASVGTVTFTAKAFNGSDGEPYAGAMPTKDVKVSFYSTGSLSVKVKDTLSSFRFSDMGIATSATTSSVNLTNLSTYSMADLIAYAMPTTSSANIPSYYVFSISSISGGELLAPTSGDMSWNSTIKRVDTVNMPTVGFQQKSSTVKSSTFTVEACRSGSNSGETITVAKISVEVIMGEGTGIKYSTTYDKAVTFSANDFVTYWNTNKIGTNSTLTHVYFNVSNLIPTYGKLYNSTAKTTAVTASMQFVPAYATTTSYSLSAATYVPEKTLTSEYSVEIPFTAYGTNNQSLNGYVTIKLNEKSNVIDARGVVLGETYVNTIASTYYTAKNQQLSYVIFELPAAKYGKLYRSIPRIGGYSRVASATEALLGDQFYVSAATGQKDLKTVSFVPAAGYDGLVTLSYTAYSAGGANPYQGTLTFDVQTKTASAVFSDVNAKNYSWASDSVDFLYYEGTAQGSNGKYNPAANITRQDFMLMLYRAFLAEDYGTFTVTSNFPDVVKGADSYSKEIYQAVGVAKYLGIAQGTNNKFNPKSNITRQEAMVLIYRTLDKINKNLDYTAGVYASSLKDYNKISSWATDAISYLVSHGVIKGNNDYIKPMDNISRAEMAAILHRVITY